MIALVGIACFVAGVAWYAWVNHEQPVSRERSCAESHAAWTAYFAEIDAKAAAEEAAFRSIDVIQVEKLMAECGYPREIP